MRIIAGEFASRRLETKKGNATRPTLDKVKEAVFSSLGGFFDGGNVLDLYAGSGAVGLEALSRGMDNAYFSDNDRIACSVIRNNIASLKVEERTKVYPIADMKMLSRMKEEGKKFRLIYLDPPYAKQKNIEVMQYIDDNDLLDENGIIVIESLQEENYHVDTFQHFHYHKESVYGIMKITYYKHN